MRNCHCPAKMTVKIIINKDTRYKDKFIQVSKRICLCMPIPTVGTQYRTVYIEGKRGRKVPVLLTKSAQAQIGLLIELR